MGNVRREARGLSASTPNSLPSTKLGATKAGVIAWRMGWLT